MDENKDLNALYEQLKQENEVLKQNAAAAQRAPVRPVTGGGAQNPKHGFLAGLESNGW